MIACTEDIEREGRRVQEIVKPHVIEVAGTKVDNRCQRTGRNNHEAES